MSDYTVAISRFTVAVIGRSFAVADSINSRKSKIDLVFAYWHSFGSFGRYFSPGKAKTVRTVTRMINDELDLYGTRRDLRGR